MKKLERIAHQEQRTREKIAAMQALLKQIDGQRTEQENLQIVQQIRALKLSRDELYAFLSGGELPPALAGAIVGPDADTAAEPERIYSRRDRKGRNKKEAAEQSDAADADASAGEEPHGDGDHTHLESGGTSNEE